MAIICYVGYNISVPNGDDSDNYLILSVIAGDLRIPYDITLTVDLKVPRPQFTLTCISTGGPATTVTWTRDSEMLTGSTVLNNATTAQYTHTLTVTGRLGGLYTCTVANDKPSSATASYTVKGTACTFSRTYVVNSNTEVNSISVYVSRGVHVQYKVGWWF